METKYLILIAALWLAAVPFGEVKGQTTVAPTVCYRMDLVFVIDRSGSICDIDPLFNYERDTTCNNWNFIVQFVYRIVDSLTISPTDTRVGVIIFGTTASVQWNLTRYPDKTSLLNAITNLPYLKGQQTNTTGGLNLLGQIFTGPDDRSDVNNTAIIITDGKPTDPATVPAAIQAVHDRGIRTLVVGVTSQVDNATLKQLSSPPQQVNVTYFLSADFSTIDTVRTQLTTVACSVPTSPTSPMQSSPSTTSSTLAASSATTMTTATTGTTLTTASRQMTDCSHVDLCFLIDRSGSICDSDPQFDYSRDNTCSNWASVVKFVHDITNTLTIGPNGVLVAVVTFASTSQVEWGLKNFTDKTSLLAAIDALPYNKGGTTDTAGGLNLLISQIFASPNNRLDSSDITIIITDGKPTDPSAVPAAINAVQSRGINTYVVGVTKSIDQETLVQLASPPKKLGMTYFIATDFRTIDSVSAALQEQTCGTTPTTNAQPQRICSDMMDLAFVVDRSGSICDSDPNFVFASQGTCQNWDFILQFINRIVDALTISLYDTRVGLVIFETNSHVEWDLTTYVDKKQLQYAITSLQYKKGGTTDTTGGLNLVNTQVFNTAGDRPTVANTAIIITDGKPTDPSTVTAAINAVHNSSIRTLVVGVTNQIDNYTLIKLSSPPQQLGVTYWFAKDFSTIDAVYTELISQACQVSTSTTTTTTTTTTQSTPTSTTMPSTTPTTTSMTSTSTTTTMSSTSISSTTSGTPATTPLICRSLLDLCFVVDMSGSICDTDPNFNYNTDNTCGNWRLIIQFIHNVLTGLQIGPNQIQVGMVIFNTRAEVRWNLTAYQTNDTLLNAVDTMAYQKGGQTNTTGGLNLMRTQVFNVPGDRPNANNTAIIITDGKPTDPSTIPAAIQAVHSSGIKTLAVGVTDQVDDGTLKQLSSPPQQLDVTYFVATSFQALDAVKQILQAQTCGPNQ